MCEISEEVCGNCAHAEVEPIGTVDCCIDNQPIQVGYYDENDCFESRTGMFDLEEMYFD